MSIIREVVVYTVKPDMLREFTERLYDAFRSEVIRQPGCLAYETLSDINNSNTFVDIVTWRSLSLAKAAANYIQQQHALGQFKMFEQAIVFKHCLPYRDWCQDDVRMTG